MTSDRQTVEYCSTYLAKQPSYGNGLFCPNGQVLTLRIEGGDSVRLDDILYICVSGIYRCRVLGPGAILLYILLAPAISLDLANMSEGNARITIEAPDVPDLIRPRSLWRDFKAQFHMRGPDDDDEQDWWLASTAIPLIAATTAPLANVMSIVALVMPWRNVVESDTSNTTGQQAQHGYSDPHW